MNRRTLLGLTASAVGSGLVSRAAFAGSATPDAALAGPLKQFQALPGQTSYAIEVGGPGSGPVWQAAWLADTPMFVGSAIKTFILAQFLRDAERGLRSEDDKLPIDDTIRSPNSPVFQELTGTVSARVVLEAMITHSDNTATDAAMAQVGVDRVRGFIADAGLSATKIPGSTRLLFSWLAGAPMGVDVGWAGIRKSQAGQNFGPVRQAINDQVTMMSTSNEFVSYYKRALKGAFFDKPATLTEFRRIQAMADAIARVVPPNIAAFAKGGSIDWADFHALSLPGQMVLGATPVTFCFTVNWTGDDGAIPTVQAAYMAAVKAVLAQVADAFG